MFGAQEAYPAGDLAGAAEPADGDLGDDLFQHRLGHRGDHFGVDIARRNGVDRDPEARAFLRQRLGEAVDPAFGGGVIDLAVLPRLAVDRPDVDDPAPAAFLHSRESGLGGVEAAAQIGAHDRVPIVIAHFQQRAVAGDAGIVDDHVDRPVFPFDPGAGLVDRVGIADIEARGGQARLLGEPRRRVGVARVIGNDGETALVAQPFADRAADPARAPGYDSHP